MNSLDADLTARLDELSSAGLRRALRRVDSPPGREVVIAGRRLLNFSSNDYLGLATHPRLTEAAARAAHDFGAGSGASRLICGSLAPHHELEEALAAWKQAPAALSFGSGFAAALGVIPALAGRDDVVILDRLVHACCVDAARLSGATLRVSRHNDPGHLEELLRWADQRRSGNPKQRTLVVTESVFSMDGDCAPLREIVELKDRFGAWLLLDEAHATGLFGQRRGGLAEAAGVSDRVEVQFGTLGKALGAAGGYVCGSRPLVDFLINRARSFIFSTAPVPAAAAAAREAVALMQGSEGEVRCARAWLRIRDLAAELQGSGFAVPAPASAIVPLMVGAECAAVALATALLERGALAPAIRFPTVARGRARLRITASAAHEAADIRQFGDALREASAATHA